VDKARVTLVVGGGAYRSSGKVESTVQSFRGRDGVWHARLKGCGMRQLAGRLRYAVVRTRYFVFRTMPVLVVVGRNGLGLEGQKTPVGDSGGRSGRKARSAFEARVKGDDRWYGCGSIRSWSGAGLMKVQRQLEQTNTKDG
jgi:hypothetical protein